MKHGIPKRSIIRRQQQKPTLRWQSLAAHSWHRPALELHLGAPGSALRPAEGARPRTAAGGPQTPSWCDPAATAATRAPRPCRCCAGSLAACKRKAELAKERRPQLRLSATGRENSLFGFLCTKPYSHEIHAAQQQPAALTGTGKCSLFCDGVSSKVDMVCSFPAALASVLLLFRRQAARWYGIFETLPQPGDGRT